MLTAVLFASCQEQLTEGLELPAAENNIAGEWQVKAYIEGKEVSGSFNLTTSYTSAGTDSITLKDSSLGFWNFQVKAAVPKGNSIFHSQLSYNEISNYEIAIKIMNGKVVGTDSIYLEMLFEDDETPFGNTYQIMGRRLN